MYGNRACVQCCCFVLAASFWIARLQKDINLQTLGLDRWAFVPCCGVVTGQHGLLSSGGSMSVGGPSQAKRKRPNAIRNVMYGAPLSALCVKRLETI